MRDLLPAVVELGYRPRHIDDDKTLLPGGDGVACRPPELAIVLARGDQTLDVGLLQRISELPELGEAPVLLALEPAHLRATPEVALSHELLLKPFSVEELRARVARAARDVRTVATSDVLCADALELDLATYRVTIGQRPVHLRPMEYELLKFFVMHPRRVFSREALLSRVWGYEYYGGARTVDVHVRRIRSMLGEHAGWIRTVRSVGYLFDTGEKHALAAA
jgi:DNA-binding winged helix-turn-helix (wHTH) protein